MLSDVPGITIYCDITWQAQEGNLVTRPERWNLVFTDFKYEEFKRDNLEIMTSFLTLKKEVCCRLIRQDKDCRCPDDFKVCPSSILYLRVLLY